MKSSCFSSTRSIAQITWPTKQISTRLCDKCDHSVHLDAQLLDFHDVLARSRSGYNPTASERLTYLAKLEETRCEIDRHEKELRRLREVTQKLEEQQRLLQAFEGGIKRMISPIQSLPLEILGVIFQYVCCGKDATDIANNYNFRPYETKRRLPTFDVSSVCIRWHRLVTSMPILWTSFGNDGFNSKSQSLVLTFLERSRSNLFDFRLSNNTVQRGFPPSPLVSHCNRWRHVSIAGTFLFVSKAFLEPLVNCGETPSNMMSLDLECDSSHSFEIPIVFPSLESLVLRGFILGFETPQYTVTTLSLSKVTCNDALSILVHLPNVESLKVEDIRQDDIEDDPPVPLVLNKMQTLTLLYPVWNDFLTSIKCPHLASLCLCNSRDFRRFESRATLSLLDQSDCAPTYLSLQNMSIHREELLRLLRLVPSLTHLDVEEPITFFYIADTVGCMLDLLAAPRHLGLQERNEISDSSGDEDLGGDASHSDTDEDSESDPGQEGEDGSDEDGSDEDSESESEQEDEDGSDEDSESESEQEGEDGSDEDDLQELLLPQLVELNLSLKPRNELLLDVVRSRRPMLTNSLGHSTDRTWLRTLRMRYPNPFVRTQLVPEQFEALQKSLKPFKEEGLDVEIKIPVLDV
ncbi:hypothetical protein FB446DRAFT_751144 [Lentinula raphanica]|nr:hypothetical protein FB446DRAFT_751144 [Lentinula raphanica]